MSNNYLYAVIYSVIGGIIGGFLAFPIYNNPLMVLGAVLSGAFVCGGLYVGVKIVEGTAYINAEREARCIMDAITQNRHEDEAKQ